jgi:hypothetical protein
MIPLPCFEGHCAPHGAHPPLASSASPSSDPRYILEGELEVRIPTMAGGQAKIRTLVTSVCTYDQPVSTSRAASFLFAEHEPPLDGSADTQNCCLSYSEWDSRVISKSRPFASCGGLIIAGYRMRNTIPTSSGTPRRTCMRAVPLTPAEGENV